MSKAEKYIPIWLEEKYGGSKEIEDWTPEDVIRFADDYLKAEGNEDTKRLDKLQNLSRGKPRGWILRESISGRGMILHEPIGYEDNSLGYPHPDIRKVIDEY